MRFLRGSCSRCGRTGATKKDGTMWAHQCGGMTYETPSAINIQTGDYRVDVFVRAMLPHGSEAAIAAAKRLVCETFGIPPAADAVARPVADDSQADHARLDPLRSSSSETEGRP